MSILNNILFPAKDAPFNVLMIYIYIQLYYDYNIYTKYILNSYNCLYIISSTLCTTFFLSSPIQISDINIKVIIIEREINIAIDE